MRRVSSRGGIQVARQSIQIGMTHAAAPALTCTYPRRAPSSSQTLETVNHHLEPKT